MTCSVPLALLDLTSLFECGWAISVPLAGQEHSGVFSISTLQCMGERASPWQDYSPCVTFREKLGQKSLETCRVFFFFWRLYLCCKIVRNAGWDFHSWQAVIAHGALLPEPRMHPAASPSPFPQLVLWASALFLCFMSLGISCMKAQDSLKAVALAMQSLVWADFLLLQKKYFLVHI